MQAFSRQVLRLRTRGPNFASFGSDFGKQRQIQVGYDLLTLASAVRQESATTQLAVMLLQLICARCPQPQAQQHQ